MRNLTAEVHLDTVARLKCGVRAAVRVKLEVDEVDGSIRANARVVEVTRLVEEPTLDDMKAAVLRSELEALVAKSTGERQEFVNLYRAVAFDPGLARKSDPVADLKAAELKLAKLKLKQQKLRKVTIAAGGETITAYANQKNFNRLVGNPRFIPEATPRGDGTFEPTGVFQVAKCTEVAVEKAMTERFHVAVD